MRSFSAAPANMHARSCRWCLSCWEGCWYLHCQGCQAGSRAKPLFAPAVRPSALIWRPLHAGRTTSTVRSPPWCALRTRTTGVAARCSPWSTCAACATGPPPRCALGLPLSGQPYDGHVSLPACFNMVDICMVPALLSPLCLACLPDLPDISSDISCSMAATWCTAGHARCCMPGGPKHGRACRRCVHAQGLPVHLDGARVFNAAAALRVDVREITSLVTTVQFCLSKARDCFWAVMITSLSQTLRVQARPVVPDLFGSLA